MIVSEKNPLNPFENINRFFLSLKIVHQVLVYRILEKKNLLHEVLSIFVEFQFFCNFCCCNF